MKSILIIIYSHLNLIVRLPISLFNMSQNYASNFSSLLNSFQYLSYLRDSISSVLSIGAYTSTAAPWHYPVHRPLIIPLNETFMRLCNKVHDVFFQQPVPGHQNFLLLLILVLAGLTTKERFFSTCTSGTPPATSQQNFTEYKIHTKLRVSQKVILNGF